MHVKLKVVQGKLQSKSGSQVASEVTIRRPRFLIGGAEDCHMRCASRSISAHHCEILVDDRGVRIHDLHSETGTFVNDQPVGSETLLSSGDRLRMGRLEFAVQIEQASGADAVAEMVSSLLVDADEQERARRLEDPEVRHFRVEAADLGGRQQAEEEEDKAGKLKRPPKRPPAKLPPPPKYVAENTIQAAEETLRKIFTPKK